MAFTFGPFEALMTGDLFGAIYGAYTITMGFFFFTLVWISVVAFIIVRNKSLVAGGIAGTFTSIPMVGWPGSERYLGVEGQFVAIMLLIFSVAILLIGIALKRRTGTY